MSGGIVQVGGPSYRSQNWYDDVLAGFNWNIYEFDACDWRTKMFTDTGATTPAADGQAVARWNAGNAGARVDYVSQSSAGLMPTLDVDAFGGAPGVVFASDWLYRDLGSALAHITDFWLFAVWKATWPGSGTSTVISSHDAAYDASEAVAANRLKVEYTLITFDRMYVNGRSHNITGDYASLNDGNMISVIRNRETATASRLSYLNDVEAVTTNGGTAAMPAITDWDARSTILGARVNSSSPTNIATDLTLGGVWCTTDLLTAQNETDISQALNVKFGLGL